MGGGKHGMPLSSLPQRAIAKRHDLARFGSTHRAAKSLGQSRCSHKTYAGARAT
jgi:hypothetical protein